MKKTHPDEDKIPTLRDLVFPGNEELRRPPEHERERIEPRLEADDDVRLDASSPAESGQEHPADPFILLPEDELDWEDEQTTPHAPAPSETTAPPPSEPITDTDEIAVTDAVEASPAPPEEETDSAAIESEIVQEDTDNGIEVEEEVSIEDLMTYFHHPKTPDSSSLAPAQTAPQETEPETVAPAPEQAAADEPLTEEDIRAAVRGALEQEFDSLTDIVTQAVLARLRD
jgi:hypothetical protein